MGVWIRQDAHLGDHVPGTALLDDVLAKRMGVVAVEDPSKTRFKHNKDGVVLVPQPSNEINDPLNWPAARKISIIMILAFGAGICGAYGPVISAGQLQVAEELRTTSAVLSAINGDLIVTSGLVLVLISPLIRIFGRRGVFLGGTTFMLAGSIVVASSTTVSGLRSGRIIGGVGTSPLECMVQMVIADLFFVHERGTFVALWGFGLLAGVNGVNIVNGYLIEKLPWQDCFWIIAGLCGLLLLLQFFCMPETAFNRTDPMVIAQPGFPMQRMSENDDLDKEEVQNLEIAAEQDQQLSQPQLVNESPAELAKRPHEGDALYGKRKSWLASLKPFSSERYLHEPVWRVFVRPGIIICSPVIAWGTLLYSVSIGWIVMISVSISVLFSSPQFGYGFSAGPVGLIAGVSPFLGAIVGSLVGGPTNDWICRTMSRRNKGIFEPEFRLIMIAPQIVLQTIGFFGWGWSASAHSPWIVPTIMLFLINTGGAFGNTAIIAYIIDAHPRYIAEAFTIVNVIRNFWSFGLTYYVIDWILGLGVTKTFYMVGGINLAVMLTTVPMYHFGKIARSWVHRTKWMLA